jgi:hypothetical protein
MVILTHLIFWIILDIILYWIIDDIRRYHGWRWISGFAIYFFIALALYVIYLLLIGTV